MEAIDMEYYLISTEHLTDSLWFRDEEDFKIGMNHVAATVWVTGGSSQACSALSSS